MSKRGTFIAFEGPDGSGKSTQARILAEKLDAVHTREPGGSSFGSEVRSILLDPAREIDPVAELFLIAADRAQHIKELVLPQLEKGRTVVTDRFTGSSEAIQGVTRGLGLITVRQVCQIATDGLTPDLTFMVDVPPEARAERIDIRAERDRFESENDHFRTIEREAYLALAGEYSNWVTVDGSGTVDQVAAQIDGILAGLGELNVGY